MRVTDPQDDDLFGRVPQRLVYLGALAAAAVFFACNALWGYGVATAASVSTGMIIAVALICLPDWQHRWFRLTYGALIAIHLAAVVLIPWSDENTPGFHVIPFAFADAFASLGIIWLVERLVGKQERR
jgi:hypothetical protein